MMIQEAIITLEKAKAEVEWVYPLYIAQAIDIAIRSLEAWDRYAEDLDALYEDEKKNRYLIREWIEKGGDDNG